MLLESKLWITLAATAFVLAFSPLTSAQITPDNTLGSESSRVIHDVQVRGRVADRISGGAIRGSNLFHSFSEFNINNGQRVYFNSPAGIENILGRVTGRDVSDVSGTLGVAGNANLFLINPNGFIFGSNARLDVRGSFTASTADRFSLGNRRFFSTLNPQAPPLLTVNVPIGLQYNPGRGNAGRIESRGILSAGQNLTLNAGFLDLGGQLRAGRNLLLQAQSTLQMSSTSIQQFIAESGGDMRLQGNTAINIFAAQPTTQPILMSGGNLLLLSDGIVTTNALFNSAEMFAVRRLNGTPGYWVSESNATVNVRGDYAVGNYRGPSLQINAGGDIDYGTVVITALNPAVNSNYPIFALNAGGQIRGTGNVSSTRELPGLAVSLVSQNDIDIQGIITRGGPIRLLSRLGDITTRDLISGSIENADFIVLEEFDGAAIALSARDNISVRDSSAYSYTSSRFREVGYGGIITFFAGENITARDLNSSSSSNSTSLTNTPATSENSGNAGSIVLSAGANITARDLSSLSNSGASSVSGAFAIAGDSGDGGSIVLSAGEDITAGTLFSVSGSNSYLSSGSRAVAGNSGDGGAILLSAGRNIAIDFLSSGSRSSSTSFSTTGTVAIAGNSGDGGTVIFSAGENIVVREFVESASESTASSGSFFGSSSRSVAGDSGNGGDILLSAGGSIIAEVIDSSSSSLSFSSSSPDAVEVSISGNSGNGGAVIFSAGRDIASSAVNSSSGSFPALGSDSAFPSTSSSNLVSRSGNSSNGGAITFHAIGNIDITGNEISLITPFLNSYSYSESRNSGSGGRISLVSINGNINGSNLRTNLNSFSASSAQGTVTGSGGDINLEAQGHITNLEALTLSSSSLAGNVQIHSPTNLSISNIRFLTSQQVAIANPINDATIALQIGGIGQSGQVAISSLGSLSVTNSSIQSDAKGSAPAGDVLLYSPERIAFYDSEIVSNTSSTGQAGSIRLAAPNMRFVRSTLAAGANATSTQGGTGGSIQLSAEAIALSDSNFTVSATAQNSSGNLTITTQTLNLQNGSIISAETGLSLENEQSANIRLEQLNLLLMEDNSLISARAFGEADGGNVTINAQNGYVIGSPSGNSDIIATAEQGNGGQINIRANRIFGFIDQTDAGLSTVQLRTNSTSDISASSDFGAAGTTALTTLTVDPSRGLAGLPTVITDATQQIARRCGGTLRDGEQVDEFIISGRGGLPEDPRQPLMGQVVWEDERGERREVEGGEMGEVAEVPIAEAQGWIVDRTGTVVLVAQQPKTQGAAEFRTLSCQ